MEYDIKKITKWIAPSEDGASILCMPNVPLPLHGLAPRTIVGQSKWDIMRKRCYMQAGYKCQASGKELGHGKCQAHELYDVDWENQTITFRRAVCLDAKLHTLFIHSGRALTLFERGDHTVTKSNMIKTLEEGFNLINKWNKEHPDEEPLRVSATFLAWAKNPQLANAVTDLIEQYHIKFYDFALMYLNRRHWQNWRLLYAGKEYPTKFKNQQEWEEYYKPKPEPEPEPEPEEKLVENVVLSEEAQAELDKMLEGEE